MRWMFLVAWVLGMAGVQGQQVRPASEDRGLRHEAPSRVEVEPWVAPAAVTLPVPVGWWNFQDCPQSDGVLHDRSPQAAHGRRAGGPAHCRTGVDGRADFLDGSYLFVVPHRPVFDFSSSLTISALVRPMGPGGEARILDKWHDSPSPTDGLDSYGLALRNGHYEFTLVPPRVILPGGRASEEIRYTLRVPARVGAWEHVVGVFDGSRMSLYVNGVRIASRAVSIKLQQTTWPVRIGGGFLEKHSPFTLDDVRLYAAALSEEQILALGRELAPFTANDLSVHYIQREPRFDRYDVRYSPPDYNPSLAPGTEDARRWPDEGEEVEYIAHVVNQGGSAAAPFRYRWLIDGRIIFSGAYDGSLAPRGGVKLSLFWLWKDGDHTVRFEVLDASGLPLDDGLPVNNQRQQNTNALLFTMYVWDNFADWAARNTNAVGTKSAEDWIQFHIDEMNRLFALSRYPSQPEGVVPRVVVDRFVRVPSSTPDPDGTHAPEPCPTDSCWGFGGPDPAKWLGWIQSVYAQRDNGLLHEWGHQIGLIDLYTMDVQISECFITGGPAQVQTFSDSSAGPFLQRLFDGEPFEPIGTLESRPVWFALRFPTDRSITRVRVKFYEDMTHEWELWSAPDLPSAVAQDAPAQLRASQTTVSPNWGDVTFDGDSAPVWLLRVKRLDYDKMPHVSELELYEGDTKLDVAALFQEGLVAGGPLMPPIAWDVVHYNSIPDDLMSSMEYRLEEYHVWALNMDANWEGRGLPLRRGYYGRYLFDIPEANVLEIRDGRGALVPDAQIEVFQQQRGLIPNIPKYAGTTDDSGRWSFPGETTLDYAYGFGRTEAISTRNPFSTIYSDFPSVLGNNGVLVIRVTYGQEQQAYRFLDLPAFNLEVAHGHSKQGVYVIQVP